MQTSAIRMPSAEPNVTPMIDVLLVLLIVFMTVVMQVHHTMDVQLPSGGLAVRARGPTSIDLLESP